MGFHQNATQKIVCNSCNTDNFIIVTFAGDSKANRDRESANCISCKAEIHEERCFGIFTGGSPESAQASLTRFQTGGFRPKPDA